PRVAMAAGADGVGVIEADGEGARLGLTLAAVEVLGLADAGCDGDGGVRNAVRSPPSTYSRPASTTQAAATRPTETRVMVATRASRRASGSRGGDSSALVSSPIGLASSRCESRATS